MGLGDATNVLFPDLGGGYRGAQFVRFRAIILR